MTTVGAIVDYTRLPLETLEEQLTMRGLSAPTGGRSELCAALRQDDLARNLEPGNYELLDTAELLELSAGRRIRPRRTSRQTLERILKGNDTVIIDRLRHEIAITPPDAPHYGSLVEVDRELRAHGINLTAVPLDVLQREATSLNKRQPLPRGRSRSRSARQSPPLGAGSSPTAFPVQTVTPLSSLPPEERLRLLVKIMDAIRSH